MANIFPYQIAKRFHIYKWTFFANSWFAMIEEIASAYLLLPPRKSNLKITSMMLMHNVLKIFFEVSDRII